MRHLIITSAALCVTSAAFAQGELPYRLLDSSSDFTAPSVVQPSDVTNRRVGMIIYDQSSNRFLALDSQGNWDPMTLPGGDPGSLQNNKLQIDGSGPSTLDYTNTGGGFMVQDLNGAHDPFFTLNGNTAHGMTLQFQRNGSTDWEFWDDNNGNFSVDNAAFNYSPLGWAADGTGVRMGASFGAGSGKTGLNLHVTENASGQGNNLFNVYTDTGDNFSIDDSSEIRTPTTFIGGTAPGQAGLNRGTGIAFVGSSTPLSPGFSGPAGEGAFWFDSNAHEMNVKESPNGDGAANFYPINSEGRTVVPNGPSANRPSCDANHHYWTWMVTGSGGADTLTICQYDGTGYSWVTH